MACASGLGFKSLGFWGVGERRDSPRRRHHTRNQKNNWGLDGRSLGLNGLGSLDSIGLNFDWGRRGRRGKGRKRKREGRGWRSGGRGSGLVWVLVQSASLPGASYLIAVFKTHLPPPLHPKTKTCLCQKNTCLAPSRLYAVRYLVGAGCRLGWPDAISQRICRPPDWETRTCFLLAGIVLRESPPSPHQEAASIRQRRYAREPIHRCPTSPRHI